MKMQREILKLSNLPHVPRKKGLESESESKTSEILHLLDQCQRKSMKGKLILYYETNNININALLSEL